eukprot:364259-Chlamydomonas_euryale.AAC.12
MLSQRPRPLTRCPCPLVYMHAHVHAAAMRQSGVRGFDLRTERARMQSAAHDRSCSCRVSCMHAAHVVVSDA